ncbi:MAG: S1 RNA-binding domain-containing protein [Lachnospiraceae bacterium]|nr:S1 RNA-binding domain-containing protein [Lachnospiraceae bacterium]
MIEIGVKQKLTVINMVDFGIYLGEPGREEKVLLPKKQVPEGTKPGDEMTVFIYRDSEDRLIATTREPQMQLGEIALLAAKEVNDIGAFFDWGLEKDLLVPYKEQLFTPIVGNKYLVALYVDKSSRLCGTMRVYDFLRADAPYKKEDMVHGTVYEIHEEIGVFVAVDNKYHGVIPKKEVFGTFQPGDPVEARVTEVREDGKLNLSVRKKAYQQMDEDCERILRVMEKYKGVLPYTDKTVDPERVKKEFHLSKAAFKRAIGRLLKENKIEITDNTIQIIKEERL